jgi:hypothetical protein
VQQVVGDGGAGQPSSIGGKPTRGQVRKRAAVQVGEGLLDRAGAVAALGLGLPQSERGVGEDR